MNILFTDICNKKCPYCFARGKLSSTPKTADSFLNLEDLRIIINFMKKSRQTKIGVIGGEPTLHPEFPEAVSMLLAEGFFVRIFSNGIITAPVRSFFEKIGRKNWEITLNMNPPETYTPGEKHSLDTTMRALKNKIQLGITLYSLDFNADFMLNLIKTHSLDKIIRLGIANPLFGQNNEYIKIENHKKLAPKIMNFAKKCDKENIALIFDCGFTLCSFSEKEIGRLFCYNASFTTSICRPALDIGPDLSVWGCFPTSKLWNKKLTDFKNFAELNKFYSDKFAALRSSGTAKRCLQCKYFLRAQCAGGCLGHTLKFFNGR